MYCSGKDCKFKESCRWYRQYLEVVNLPPTMFHLHEGMLLCADMCIEENHKEYRQITPKPVAIDLWDYQRKAEINNH